jgi:RNA polymerase subunit RPABC4/transcription elongation factor Spt4
VEALEREYAGTRAGRQELEGEMLEDFEGALWKREFIENHRVRPEDFNIDQMTRIVVAVDPSMTSGEKADESGIVVAGMDSNKEGYLIADLSCHGTPEKVMREAVAAYYKYAADCVVMEANQGGDYLTTALRAVDPGVPPRIVRAQKGKLIRAQPISMLAEQGRLHHVGYFPKLEDQLCIMTPDNKREHDDRADAFVWAFSELRGITEGSYLDAYGYKKCESCQYTYNKSHGQCPRCGFKPAREEKPLSPGDWAKAYKNTCRKCGTVYPQREAVCPNCQPSPFTYMAKVAQFSGGHGTWLNYQSRNI